MGDPLNWRLWGNRALFAAAAMLLMLTGLIPNETGADHWPGPDILLVLTMCWLLRNPAQVPVALIAAVFLLADFLLQRPPGLRTALVIGVTEYVRSREIRPTEMTLPVEWAVAALAITVILVAERILLLITGVPVVTTGITTIHILATVLSYPLVLWVATLLLRLREPTNAETSAWERLT